MTPIFVSLELLRDCRAHREAGPVWRATGPLTTWCSASQLAGLTGPGHSHVYPNVQFTWVLFGSIAVPVQRNRYIVVVDDASTQRQTSLQYTLHFHCAREFSVKARR